MLTILPAVTGHDQFDSDLRQQSCHFLRSGSVLA